MSVEENWQRLHDWCLREAPITAAAIDPPADQSVVDEIEALTGRKWPTELRTWFGLQNGNPDGRHSALIFPEYQPLPLDLVASRWASMTAMWADTTEAVGGLSLLDEPAGEVSGTYLSAYIPIAFNIRGDLLFVDTRAGKSSGCVRGFMGEDNDQGESWPSIDSLLEEVVSSLEHGHPCRGWVPSIDDGWLHWEFP
ncbi:SMI1/KNR4 family protein [Rhodococcus globerulus]|uniref:SMI1/KNR4 family protein n=1 Tax=Rhodococcus globerulus TaxID=33008 RepID=UPI001F1854BA|nr:SMI1/KNR4 family protein [Rhodococcus globerulus]MCE4265287.1 hypothetical protein [Rhodococcus globerulus]